MDHIVFDATPEEITEARAWMRDAFPRYERGRTDREVIDSVSRLYPGGWSGFMYDHYAAFVAA